MVNKSKVAWQIEKAGLSVPEQVQKRDGRLAPFDVTRIEGAVLRCYAECESTPTVGADDIAVQAAFAVSARFANGSTPSIEAVQDAVEYALQSSGEFEAARRFILYREQHAQERKLRPVPDDVKAAFDEAALHFPTDAQQFTFFDKYSRYSYELGRRETWIETVDRTVAFLKELADGAEGSLPDSTFDRIHDAILGMRAMPSMRLLATAGDYARENSLAIYNCSYLPVSDTEAFCEAMLLSMSGCGVGYSVESDYVDQFSRVRRQKKRQVVEHLDIEDSTEGWVEALRLGLSKWMSGEDITFGYDGIRRAGLPLRRKGGRASGPDPLRAMLGAIRGIILKRQGTFLRPIDAHDIMCHVGDAAVQGGVRRTAMIALFDWDDREMRECKTGIALDQNPVRWNANNSAVWPEDLTQQDLIQQMLDMDKGQRGEPGIFSRENAVRNRPPRRKKARFGTNPCGEINLRPYGLCNLSIAVGRVDDTIETLKEKVEIAAIIGTIQSLATNFPGMRDEWVQNAIEERLLGVDITGQQDCPVIRDPEVMKLMKAYAVEVNEATAALLKINPSAAVTTDKPGGNSSQFLDVANGIHARHSAFLVRNMRVAATSPVARALREQGVPMNPENGQTVDDCRTWVIPFPMKSPEGAILRRDMNAIAQLEYWLMAKENWTEHNPSCTVSYAPDELLDIIKWVWEHREQVGGLSFLPLDDAQYEQLPYTEITEDEYNSRVAAFPSIDFSRIYRYELEDMTTATHELACFAGSCEV